MKTVRAEDCRWWSKKEYVTVTYNEEDVKEFDTRGENYSAHDDAWGQKVRGRDETGKLADLILTYHSYGDGTIKTEENYVID